MECNGGLGHLRPMRFVLTVTNTIVSNLGIGNHMWWENVVDPSGSFVFARLVDSAGWINCLVLWLVHVVGSCARFMQLIQIVQYRVGSIGWFGWLVQLVHVDDSMMVHVVGEYG